jgi:NADH:ubiquinone oxidoreductase subunit K
MKKIVITCGLIAGAIGSVLMAIGLVFFEKNQTGISQVIGYTSLLLSVSLIFVGIKKFRDKHNGGVVSFGKAFLIGLYISLIASTIYVVVWALEYKFIFPNFLDTYSAITIAKTKASGAGPEKMAEQLKELATYRDLYKNPVFFTLITYAQFLPGGLIGSLIAALILKRRNK